MENETLLERASLMTFPMLIDEVFGVMNAAKIIELASRNGIKRLDVMNLSEKGAVKYSEEMEKKGMRSGCYIENVSCFTPRDERKKRFESAVFKSKTMGGDRIMLLPTSPGDRKRMTNLGRDSSMKLLTEYFKDAVEICAAEGTAVTFENTPCDFSLMQRSEDITELCGRVDGLKLAFDTGLPLSYGKDPFEFYKEVRNCVGHVHIRDATASLDGKRLKTCAYGRGTVPLKTIREELKKDGYDGLLALEYCRPGAFLSGLKGHDAFLKEFLWFFA